jgi:2-[hydroxy(phenyl)methyl]-succinyl-CoA dehydrogenase BbsC subunit
MQADVKVRVALVVGATGEIGEAIARQLASVDVQLALAAADTGQLDVLAGNLGNVKVMTVAVDPTDPAAVADCVNKVLARYGKIDILVNNAGEVTGKPLGGLTASDVAAAVNTALLAPYHFIREVVPRMQQSGYGRVVNISDLGYLGLPNQTNVAAARAGLFGLTRSAALESARSGVTVNTVVKGDIATSATTDGEKDKVAAGIPVKRLGTPVDVARVVGFFAAESTKYLTGQTLFVCGGKSAYFSMSV